LPPEKRNPAQKPIMTFTGHIIGNIIEFVSRP
jgi:hypothetical protein